LFAKLYIVIHSIEGKRERKRERKRKGERGRGRERERGERERLNTQIFYNSENLSRGRIPEIICSFLDADKGIDLTRTFRSGQHRKTKHALTSEASWNLSRLIKTANK